MNGAVCHTTPKRARGARFTLSGTVQLNSVHEEHDEDITFCLKLDQQSQQNLQHELGVNARDLPTEIHMEIVPYALDRSGNAIFPGIT